MICFWAFSLSSTLYAVDLSDVTQKPDQMFFNELVARLGCEKASDVVAMPKGGYKNFLETLEKMKAAGLARAGRSDRLSSWTKMNKRELFDLTAIKQQCPANQNQRGMADGLTDLLALAPEGITILSFGGFGSHRVAEGAISRALATWELLKPELISSGKIRLQRIECSSSYSPDETFCAKDMLATIVRLDSQSPNPGRHKYVLWGYSKGGTTAIEMLRIDTALRERTLAVISAGSPMQGSMVMDSLSPAIENAGVAGDLSAGANAARGLAILPLIQLWTNDGQATVQETLDSFPMFRAGAQSMTESERARYIAQNFSRGQFLRAGGSKIPVFQIAGLVDPERLKPVSVLTVRNGKLVPVEASSKNLDKSLLAGLLTSGKHPMSDACVALEEALLPESSARGAGLDPHFLAFLRRDHLSLHFRGSNAEPAKNAVDHAIIDSALSTIARRIMP